MEKPIRCKRCYIRFATTTNDFVPDLYMTDEETGQRVRVPYIRPVCEKCDASLKLLESLAHLSDDEQS